MEIKTIFKHNQEIPTRYTCLGPNISLPLSFQDIPLGTESLALIFEDMDSAPTWTHWIVFNIPADTQSMAEGEIPVGSREALANNHTFGYEGPCPKYFKGTHRYQLSVYALGIKLDLPDAPEREEVEKAMEGQILEQAFLIGLCTSE